MIEVNKDFVEIMDDSLMKLCDQNEEFKFEISVGYTDNLESLKRISAFSFDITIYKDDEYNNDLIYLLWENQKPRSQASLRVTDREYERIKDSKLPLSKDNLLYTVRIEKKKEESYISQEYVRVAGVMVGKSIFKYNEEIEKKYCDLSKTFMEMVEKRYESNIKDNAIHYTDKFVKIIIRL